MKIPYYPGCTLHTKARGFDASAKASARALGLELAELAEETKTRLRGVVASAGTSVRNPVDIGLVLGGAAEMYRRALEATIDDPGVDAVVVIGSAAQGEGWQAHVEAMAGLARAAAKPILHVSFGPGDPAVDQALAAEGIPSFPSAERALQAYARVRGDAPREG